MAIQLHLNSSPLRREVLESPVIQGANETKKYFVDFETWGASDANPVTTPDVTVWDADEIDVTSTVCAGGGSVVNDTQVYFTLTAFAKDISYRVEIEGTWDAQTLEAICRFIGD